jgi:hypothetical protein
VELIIPLPVPVVTATQSEGTEEITSEAGIAQLV